MLCPSCGAEVPDNYSFCTKCGAPLNKSAETKQKSSETNTGRIDSIVSAMKAAYAVKDTYVTDNGVIVFEYHPFFDLGKRTVCIDDFYVNANGNSIDRAHISGTKRDYKIHWWFYFIAFCLFITGLNVFLVPAFRALTSIHPILFIVYLVFAVMFGAASVILVKCPREYILIIKGSDRADAIYISTGYTEREKLSEIEMAVKTLSISHDNDNNIRTYAEQILHALNKK